MKIAFFLNLPLCQNLIHDVVSVKFAYHLACAGAEVTFVYSGQVDKEKIAAYYGIELNDRLHFVGTKRLKIKRPVRISWSLVSKVAMAIRLLHLIRTGRCDVLFTNDSSLVFLKKISDFYGITFVYETHDVPPNRSLPYILTTTEALKRKIIERGGAVNKVETLHLSPNLPSFTKTYYQSTEDLKTLIYAGKLSRNRGAYLIIDALERLPSDYRLILFGGSQQEIERLKAYAEEKQLPHAIIFEGFVAPDRLERRLAELKGVLIVPPPDNVRYRYIAHTKIFDALGRGKIIAASDLAPIREVAEDLAFLFPPGDALALAETLRSITTLPIEEINTRIDEMGIRFERFSYRSRSEKFLKFLKSI